MKAKEQKVSSEIFVDDKDADQEEQVQEESSGSEVVRHHIVQAKIRFDFALPKDVPKENGEAYAKERFNHLIEKLAGLRGVKISCLVE